jgi:hypothetical protein
MADTNETTLVICFGVFTLLATLAGLHYRDSLCCLCCRVLFNAWHRRRLDVVYVSHALIQSADVVEDVEATAGLIHRISTTQSLDTDHALVEMQPHTTFPLYFDTSMVSPEATSVT